jgi:hypothetical protein
VKLWTVEADPFGALGVFDDYDAALEFFIEVQDPALDLPSGQIQEFELGARDPEGYLRVRRQLMASIVDAHDARRLQSDQGLRGQLRVVSA